MKVVLVVGLSLMLWVLLGLRVGGVDGLGRLRFFAHMLSYSTKADDADEIGLTLVNYLMHDVILAAVGEVNEEEGLDVKTVAVGHSLGSRIQTRALFSKGFLREAF